jgi:hypothetical protein
MIDHLIYQYRKVLEHRIGVLTEKIASGKGITDYADYQKAVGDRQGLEQALREFNQIVASYGQENEDDD